MGAESAFATSSRCARLRDRRGRLSRDLRSRGSSSLGVAASLTEASSMLSVVFSAVASSPGSEPASAFVSDCVACSVTSAITPDALIAPSASARFGASVDTGSALTFALVVSPCCSFASAITTGSSAAFSKSGRGPRLRGVVFLGRWLAGRRENSELPLSSVASVFSLESGSPRASSLRSPLRERDRRRRFSSLPLRFSVAESSLLEAGELSCALSRLRPPRRPPRERRSPRSDLSSESLRFSAAALFSVSLFAARSPRFRFCWPRWPREPDRPRPPRLLFPPRFGF